MKGGRSRVEREKRSEDARRKGTESEASQLYQKEDTATLQVASSSLPICIKVIFSIVSRYFVFFALGYLVLWESYSHLSTFYTHGLADRAYGL